LDTGSIDTNVGTLVTNTGTIASDTTNILIDTGSIDTNVGTIVTNTGDISTDTGTIASDTTNILLDTGSIDTNVGTLVTNTGTIATNSADIGAINSIGPSVGSMYDRLQVSEYEQVFNVSPLYGKSDLRDIFTTTGSATLTNTGGGFTLTATALANDSASIETTERGRFSVGNAFEVGVVLTIPTAPTSATQRAIWGIYDTDNGMYFGQDSTGVFVASLRSGSETKIYQTNWNTDKLDGTGACGFTLDTSVGCMYQIRFGYNYGVIEYRVILVCPDTFRQTIVVCHRISTVSGTLVGDPNQPISAKIEIGATAPAVPFVMNLRGRYYASLGNENPVKRLTCERRLNMATSTTFKPTVSLQRLTMFPIGSTKHNSINVILNSFDIMSSDDILWQLRLNSTLTGASFASPLSTISTETCIQSDVSATAINDATGILLMEGLATGGDHANILTALSSTNVDIIIPTTNIVTLSVKTITGTGTVSVVLRVNENW
jgi:hypothetical protein